MRTILIAAAVVLVPIVPAGAVFLNGSTLHDWCLSEEVGDQEACLGYVVGVADALDVAPENEAAGVARRRLCLPELDAKTAVDAVKQYLLVHPRTGDGGAGADLVADALADAYPCPDRRFLPTETKEARPDPMGLLAVRSCPDRWEETYGHRLAVPRAGAQGLRMQTFRYRRFAVLVTFSVTLSPPPPASPWPWPVSCRWRSGRCAAALPSPSPPHPDQPCAERPGPPFVGAGARCNGTSAAALAWKSGSRWDMRWWSTWPRAARLAAIVLLLAAIIGWGMAIQRASQLHDIGARLSATELEGQSRQQRIQELESTLTRERQSAGDLASLTQRLDAAGADLAKAKEARAAAESRMDELASTIKSGEQRLAELQPQLTQAQQQLAQSQQQLADSRVRTSRPRRHWQRARRIYPRPRAQVRAPRNWRPGQPSSPQRWPRASSGSSR